MRKNLISILGIFSLSIFILSSQSINRIKLDSFFNILNEKEKAMGSLTIAKYGNPIYSKVIGYSVMNNKVKELANSESKYRVGSISKIFTAAMIFQLVDQGKLSLNMTIDKYFPMLPNAASITIGNLLNHRSGLPDFINDPDYLKWNTKPQTRDEILTILSHGKIEFQPNSKAQYSNSNYVLLGYILESTTGISYSENLKIRITNKLQLLNTKVGDIINSKNNECHSYEYNGDWLQRKETDMSIPGGAGNIISTSTDLVIFIYALFNHQLVSDSSFIKMASLKDGYGMGLFKYEFNGKTAYGNFGGIDGFGAVVGYFPDDTMSISYTTNGQVYPMDDILKGSLSIYYNQSFNFPFTSSIIIKSEDLQQFIGEYTSDQLPVKIKIAIDGSNLTAQFKGKDAFKLDAYGNNLFKYEKGDIELVFNPETNEMKMKQLGITYLFKRKT